MNTFASHVRSYIYFYNEICIFVCISMLNLATSIWGHWSLGYSYIYNLHSMWRPSYRDFTKASEANWKWWGAKPTKNLQLFFWHPHKMREIFICSKRLQSFQRAKGHFLTLCSRQRFCLKGFAENIALTEQLFIQQTTEEEVKFVYIGHNPSYSASHIWNFDILHLFLPYAQ